jgi:glycolate oxidase FAD binding subunit
VYAGFGPKHAADPTAVERAFGCVAAAAADAQGSWLCEAAPVWAKAGRDMHGDAAGLAPIFAALKQRFDPERVLNPGRFAGGL